MKSKKSQDEWLQQLVTSFPTPLPSTRLLEKVCAQNRRLLAEAPLLVPLPTDPSAQPLSPSWGTALLWGTAAVTVPCFLVLSYLYYLGLQVLLATMFPAAIAQIVMALFWMGIAMMGIVGLGSVPLCTFYLVGTSKAVNQKLRICS